MGAKQRAQKRGKHGKGSEKGSPWSQKKSNTTLHVPDLDPSVRNASLTAGWQDFAASSSGKPAFSMSQEARNTERHVSGWGTTKLRGNAVAFVSAGHLHRDEDEQDAPEEIADGADGNSPQENRLDQISQEPAEQDIENGEVDKHIEPTAPGNDASATSNGFSSLLHSSDLPDSKELPQVNSSRRQSSLSSASEVEEIIFTGRRNPPRHPVEPDSTRAISPPKLGQATETVPLRTINGTTPAEVAVLHTTAKMSLEPQPGPSAIRPEKQRHLMRLFQTEGSSSDLPRSSSESPRLNPRSRRRDRRKRRGQISDEEEAIMQDYIANMVVDDDEDEDEEEGDKAEAKSASKRTEHYRYYDGAGDENVKVQTIPARASTRADLQAIDWSSADLEDFDDLSTTDEEVLEVQQVLRHRERPTGNQYLVVGEGRGTSDAKWVPLDKLTSLSAGKEIQIFEDIRAMEETGSVEASSDELSEDDEALNDLLDDMESEDNENERIMAMTANMSDGQMARILAKQEQMGLGSDELILLDGHLDEEPPPSKLLADAFTQEVDFIPFSSASKKTNRRKSAARENFPSAAAFADALDQDPYGAFDIMDFDRPSLRPRRKGRKSDYLANLDIEDEEIAEHLHATWMKDREKKAARKRAKEEERQAAWLEFGDRAEPAAIKAEIRQFLVQEKGTLRLAPMEASTRASVHRLAKALKLNSKSEGKEGKGERYPVLSKTTYTPHYTIDTIWQIDNLLNTRKFFPKHGGGRHKYEKAPKEPSTRIRRGGGGTLSGASYMNGEVVGSSAPEIGSENKGRAMLEKMGWKSGMGIGAIGNKGSIEVIKHVVKTTKAGLG